MTFAFHPEAEDEFKDAIAYYENCDAGLGFDFAREVYAAIQNAVGYPSMWSGLIMKSTVALFTASPMAYSTAQNPSVYLFLP